MDSNADRISIGNSRSYIEANTSVRKIKLYNKTGMDDEDILSDAPKVEINRKPTTYQVQVECPSYDLIK